MTPIFRCTKRFLDAVRLDLARPHSHAAERVGFISVRPVATPRTLVLIAEAYHPVADEDYLHDPSVGAMIGSDAIRKALEIAMLENVGMFHVHTALTTSGLNSMETIKRSLVASSRNTISKAPASIFPIRISAIRSSMSGL